MEIVKKKKVAINLAKNPNFKILSLAEAIGSMNVVFNRGYQRVYGFDKTISESFSNAQLDSVLSLTEGTASTGNVLGTIGLKLKSKKDSIYSVPEGQHRWISISIYLAALIVKDSDKLRIIEYKNILFNNGIVDKDSFKFSIIGDNVGDEQNIQVGLTTIAGYILGYNKKQDLEDLKNKNEYIKTFLFYLDYIDEYVKVFENSDYDFFDIAYQGIFHTYFNVCFLNKNDNEVKYYTNSFQPSKAQKEFDRTRNIALTSVKEGIKKYTNLQNLIDTFHEKLSETIRLTSKFSTNKMEELGEAIYESVVIELTQKTELDLCVLTHKANAIDSISNKLNTYLHKKDHKKITAIDFYKECLRQLESWKYLISSDNMNSLILRNLTKKSIGDTYKRIFPVLIKITNVKDKDFLEIHKTNILFSSYLFHRITVLVNNTEKEADKFFNELYFRIRTFDSLKTINTTIESYMNGSLGNKSMIFTKSELKENLLLDREVKSTFKRSFILLKTLAVVDNLSAKPKDRIDILSNIYKCSDIYELEHLTPKAFYTTVIPRLKNLDYNQKKYMINFVKSNLNKMSNLYFISSSLNKELTNKSLFDKDTEISNRGYIGISPDYNILSRGIDFSNSLEAFEEFHTNVTAKVNEAILNYIPYKLEN